MGLANLTFSDIYVGQEKSHLTSVPGAPDFIPVALEYEEETRELRRLCEEKAPADPERGFLIKFNDVKYRATTMVSLEETVYVLRRFPAAVPKLAELGIHAGIVKYLMTPKMTGLVVIAGAYSQGKTTTASSILSARLFEYGGVAVTIEDPPEMPLQGKHGPGMCFQTEVGKGQFGNGCRQAARYAPSIIFLGEIRDGEAAAEALRASINGRLVICTVHADNAASAIERLFALSSKDVGSAEDVASLLANGLAAILHQSLEADAHGVKHPKTNFLWLHGEDSEGVRNTIRHRKFEQIKSHVQLQVNRMLHMQTPSRAVA